MDVRNRNFINVNLVSRVLSSSSCLTTIDFSGDLAEADRVSNRAERLSTNLSDCRC